MSLPWAQAAVITHRRLQAHAAQYSQTFIYVLTVHIPPTTPLLDWGRFPLLELVTTRVPLEGVPPSGLRFRMP